MVAGGAGLMGALADVMLKEGGQVTGFIPHFMVEMEWAHPGVSEMVTVRDMHERKYLMRKDVDAVIALPGGVGTLEELMEVITLKQLGKFTKPIVILNTRQFYKPLLKFLNNMRRQRFMRDIHETLWQVVALREKLSTQSRIHRFGMVLRSSMLLWRNTRTFCR